MIFFFFLMNATKKYFGLLISRHVSVADVATSHVPAGYDWIQLPNSTNLPVSASQFVHWLFLTLAKKQTQKRVKTFFCKWDVFVPRISSFFRHPFLKRQLQIAHRNRKMETQCCLEISLCELTGDKNLKKGENKPLKPCTWGHFSRPLNYDEQSGQGLQTSRTGKRYDVNHPRCRNHPKRRHWASLSFFITFSPPATCFDIAGRLWQMLQQTWIGL